MGTVYRIKDFRRRSKIVCFSRQELDLLLSVYSRRVISGEWKAYALDHTPTMAQFSIFADAHALPLFAIVKYGSPNKRQRKYAILKNGTKVAQADVLAQAVAYFGRDLRLVST